MPGATAWIGLLEHCQPKAGETVVVSAASGAVGSVVGQLAKMQGCRAVGIAGGKAKCDYVVKELGFDACVDYKAGKLYEDLKAACPDGIDCYFENVGGEVLDTVFRLLNAFSRVALCGLISDYNATEPYGVTMIRSLLVNRVNLRGFIVSDRMDLYARAIRQLGKARRPGQDQVPRDRRGGPGQRAEGVHRHAQGRELRQAAGEGGLRRGRPDVGAGSALPPPPPPRGATAMRATPADRCLRPTAPSSRARAPSRRSPRRNQPGIARQSHPRRTRTGCRSSGRD